MNFEFLTNDTLLENLATAIVVVDQQAVIGRVNLAAENLFEQSRRRLVGMPLGELFVDLEVGRRVSEVIEMGSQFTLREVTIELPNRSVLVDVTLSTVSAAQGVASAVLMELYSVSRISRFMRDTNLQERQQSFRLMMRGLAHEIKNPLGGLRGAAQLLERELEQPSQRELTGILIKEADRLTNLVDRVMGSRQQLNKSLVNVHEILEHVIDVVLAEYDTQVQIHRDYDPTLPNLFADQELLVQAVLNIVGNALEAQSDQPTAVIGLTTEFARNMTINQILYKQVIRLSIWDHGPGVAEELREVIFDPLVSGRAEGSGLGLSITQEIIQRHEGMVQLDDTQQKTCFVIYLPCIEHNDQTEIM